MQQIKCNVKRCFNNHNKVCKALNPSFRGYSDDDGGIIMECTKCKLQDYADSIEFKGKTFSVDEKCFIPKGTPFVYYGWVNKSKEDREIKIALILPWEMTVMTEGGNKYHIKHVRKIQKEK